MYTHFKSKALTWTTVWLFYIQGYRAKGFYMEHILGNFKDIKLERLDILDISRVILDISIIRDVNY